MAQRHEKAGWIRRFMGWLFGAPFRELPPDSVMQYLPSCASLKPRPRRPSIRAGAVYRKPQTSSLLRPIGRAERDSGRLVEES